MLRVKNQGSGPGFFDRNRVRRCQRQGWELAKGFGWGGKRYRVNALGRRRKSTY